MKRSTFFKSLIGLAIAPIAISEIISARDKKRKDIPSNVNQYPLTTDQCYKDRGIVYIGDEYVNSDGERYIAMSLHNGNVTFYSLYAGVNPSVVTMDYDALRISGFRWTGYQYGEKIL